LGPEGATLTGYLKYTFPSEKTFMAVVVYGFAAFIVLRHGKKRWYGTVLTFVALAVCIVTGLSVVFFNMQFPSDVMAGYVFGGVWLSLNIILLEINRVLPGIQQVQGKSAV
jgi:membrane-associated phospholipid phosphatase